MKVGVYLDILRFQEDSFSYTKLINFLEYLKNNYFSYKEIDEIFDEIWKTEKEDIKPELKIFLALDIKVLRKLREEYVLIGDWKKVELLDEAIKRKDIPSLKDLERQYFYAYTFLSRVSNISYKEFLNLDIETLNILLEDKTLENLAKYSKLF
ncbi:MAG: hypothetical protein ACPL1F_00035 [bacterium]|jgi:hypothetical protein